ncbi:hypothetical protein [Gemmatimonas sp.]|uniref:hypothetical protein n=1 Tax=Gemmatimonas sp. TaxID=1962908 RepID=UPI0037C19E8D
MPTRGFSMRARVLGAVLSTAAVSVALAVAMPTLLSAQRRPGVGMGFYTTTGLITGEVEGGSVTSSTALASSPSFEASFLLTAPLKKMPKRAWIAGVRARALALGDNDYCSVRPEPGGCQIRRFDERAAFLAGGAFDIRSTVLRALVGPALFRVEQEGTRFGTQVRLDFASPRLSGPTPTLFYTGTFLGSQRGESVVISTIGAGFRWVRKR